jgi:hypothetical protein
MPTTDLVASVPAATASFVDRMDDRVNGLLKRIESSDPYRRVFDPDADPRLVQSVVKYVLLEVFSYGPHVTEATFTAIGRMPKTHPDLMKIMVRHDLDEVDHGEMALADFVRLGGDEHWARTRRTTPASFAMAATVRMLAERDLPFAYLGYMYPFEALTPVLTARLQEQFQRKGFPAVARKFVDVHAEEDISHAKVLRHLIGQVVETFAGASEAIEYGFECFATVYPLPIWDAVLAHALDELGH